MIKPDKIALTETECYYGEQPKTKLVGWEYSTTLVCDRDGCCFRDPDYEAHQYTYCPRCGEYLDYTIQP